jgi:hypothetical protein
VDPRILSRELKIEKKRFFFDLMENPQGRYLRITELSNGRSSVIIPEDGLKLFKAVLDEFIKSD